MEYENILVSVDLGDAAMGRMRRAASLAGRFGATLTGSHASSDGRLWPFPAMGVYLKEIHVRPPRPFARLLPDELLMRERGISVGIAVALNLLVASPALADAASAMQGRAFARENCARCHAVGSREASPMHEAPPFRTLAKSFPIDDLADVLVEGAERRHPVMPDFRLDPRDAADLTAYLKSLRR